MAARLDAPVLGAQSDITAFSRWQVSTSWRHQRSDRHFRGSEEEANRQAEGSEVINTINLMELGIRYNPNPQWSVSLGIPYFAAERSSPIRDPNRVVVDRSVVEANALGDITLTARRLLWNPREHPESNISLGLGVKFPTGDYDVFDTRERLVDGQRVFTDESVDQSIQPGDGGWGAILDVSTYQRIRSSGGTLYASGTYLINPEGTNGVPTFRGAIGEEIMSIADQYLARAGVTWSGASWKGFGMSLGGRIEGVPVEDLIGDSDGFRRPGYALSVEPGLSYTRGAHAFSLAVPVAVHRNRQRSVPDRLVPGRIGDAAFADYVVMLGYWRKL
ncbi:MAG TPA: hypothetical protein VN493_24435 [Thermoanaerobaculia bacterium]|nr:hypothetical protein [Thermoanaerobaculia bacterium]